MLRRAVRHREQVRPNACVAACVGMVWVARGQPYDEDLLMQQATPRGLDLGVAATLLGGVLHPFLEVSALLQTLRAGHLLIVKLSAPRYVARCGHAPGGTASPHGALANPGEWGGPFHAVLLVDIDDEVVSFFDPWYPAAGQPLTLGLDTFVYCFAGAAVSLAG